MTIKCLAFAADGLVGITHLGAMIALNERFPQDQYLVPNVGGASVGSIWSFLYSLHLRTDTLIDVAFQVFNSDVVGSMSALSCQNIHNKYGLINLNFEFMRGVINAATNGKTSDDELFTFQEHYELTGVTLTISVYDIADSKIVYMSKDTYPNLDVITAIQASCAIPFLFTPILLDSKYYVDPVFVEKWPEMYNDCDPDSILLINNLPYLPNDLEKSSLHSDEVESVVQYFLVLMRSLRRAWTPHNTLKNSIDIPTGKDEGAKHIKELSYDDMKSLIFLGYNQATSKIDSLQLSVPVKGV